MRIFDSPGAGSLTAATRGSRDFIEPLLARAALPVDLANALDDTRRDEEICAEGDEALALTGRDVGTPIIQFGPPAGTAFFGPVISRLPAPQDAARLWDYVTGLAGFPGSPSSSGACASALSCTASAHTPARPGRKRTGTPAAARRRPSAYRVPTSARGVLPKTPRANRFDPAADTCPRCFLCGGPRVAAVSP